MDTKELEFTKLVREHKTTIYTVCYMFSKDSQQVNDLFQDILIRLWQGFSSFRAEASPRTWIYRVSLNTCINFDRKRSRTGKSVPLSVDIDPYDGTDDNALQTRQLYERISKLGLVDRSIILMWLENMSYDEIGGIVGISPKNVSVKLVRIKEQLKQMSNK